MSEQAQGKSASEDRSLYWSFCLYPGDSAPENWQEILKKQLVGMFVSPLHQPDDEELKPHRHVMLLFGSTKSYKQAKEISDAVHGAFPIQVRDKVKMARYLLHLDHPEKQQWTEEQLQADPLLSLNGSNYERFLLDNEDPFEVIQEIEDWIEEQDIFSVWEVMRYARENNARWDRALHKRTMAVDIYCKSRLWTKTKQEEALMQYKAAKKAAEDLEHIKGSDDIEVEE